MRSLFSRWWVILFSAMSLFVVTPTSQVHASFWSDVGDFFTQDIPDFFKNIFIPSTTSNGQNNTFLFPDIIDEASGPDGFHVVNLSGDRDRDGIVHLKWNTKKFSGTRAKCYQIVVLGRHNLLINSPISIEQDYFIKPIEVNDDPSSQIQEVIIDIPALLGPGLKEDLGNFVDLPRDFLNGRNTTLYFAVKASKNKDLVDPDNFVSDLDPQDNRQRLDSNGNPKVLTVPNYTFLGSKFSNVLPVSFELDSPPDKLKLLLVKKTTPLEGQCIYTPQQQLQNLTVTVGDASNSRELNLNLDDEIESVYIDRDGILDIWFVKEKDNLIPSFPQYQIQFSKWPKFTFNRETDFDRAVVNRYFIQGEKTHFLYNNFDDFFSPSAGAGELKSLTSDRYFENGHLIRPFHSKNLAVNGFERDSQGSLDFGRPTYFQDSEYGAVNGVYYIRARALGLPSRELRLNHDNRYGDWSRIVAVKVEQNPRLMGIHFTESPFQIDQRRAEAKRLIPAGLVPVNFRLDNKQNSHNASQLIYQIAVSPHADLIVNLESFKVGAKEGRNFGDEVVANRSDYFLDYVLPDAVALAPNPNYTVNMLFNSGVVPAGRYYLWIRTVLNEPDAIPSLWSAPVSVDLPRFEQLLSPRPDLKPIIASISDLNKGFVPLSWSLHDVQPIDPRNSQYTNNQDGNNIHFIPSYQVLVYNREDVNPVGDGGYIKFCDDNSNGINDWVEIQCEGGAGKAYSTYTVTPQQFEQASVAENQRDVLYRVPLLTIPVVPDKDSQSMFEQRIQVIEPGLYDFYVISNRITGHQSLVSQGQSLSISTRIEPRPLPPRTQIGDVDLGDLKVTHGQIPLNWTMQATPSDPRNAVYREKSLEEGSLQRHIPFYQLLIYRTDFGQNLSDDQLPYARRRVIVADFEGVVRQHTMLYNDLISRGYISAQGDVLPAFSNLTSTNQFVVSASFMPQKQRIYNILCVAYFALKEVDVNKDEVNNFTEVGCGAYATYMIQDKDILPVPTSKETAAGARNVLYYIPLLKIFKSTCDAAGNIILERKIKAIERGSYHMFLRAFNASEEPGVLSHVRRVDISNRIVPIIPPKPNLVRPNATDRNSLNVKEKALIPVSWTLGAQQQSPLANAYSNRAQSTYIPFYRVLFYQDLPAGQSPCDAQGNLVFLDVDKNGVNDWLERPSESLSGRLFTTFLVTTKQLEKIAQEELLKAENSDETRTTVDLPSFLEIDTFYKPKLADDGTPLINDAGKLQFEADFHEVPIGTYSVFVFPINLMELEGPLSDPKTIQITKHIEDIQTPDPLQLDPITPNPDRNGIIGLNWTLKGRDPTERDRLDFFPLYEINIAKHNATWQRNTFAVEYVKSLGDFPLMVPVSPGSKIFRKVSKWPWVRNLNDPDFPLNYRRLGEVTPVSIGFENDAMYYIRVRALSHEGPVAKRGEWSNTEAVRVDLRSDMLHPPIVSRTQGPERNWNYQDPSEQIIVNDLFLKIYAMYYQFNPQLTALQKQESQMIEIYESESSLFETIREVFYLDTNRTEAFSINGDEVFTLKRSPFTTVDPKPEFEVQRPLWGQTYYYKARFIGFNENSPDRMNDLPRGRFGKTVRVNVPTEEPSGASPGSEDPHDPRQKTWRL